MRKIRQLVLSALVTAGLVGMTSFAAPVGAVDPLQSGCAANRNSTICRTSGSNVNTFVADLVRILLWVIGVVSVIMIIVGGLRYVLSQGDAGKIKSAKDTILYSVIGLVVALLAFAIVNYVLGYF